MTNQNKDIVPRIIAAIVVGVLGGGIWLVAWHLLTLWPMTEVVSMFYIFYIAGSFLFAIVSPVLLAVGLLQLCKLVPNMLDLEALAVLAGIAYFCYIIWTMFLREWTVFGYIYRIMTTGPP
jgi:hypothetical protein